LYNERLRLLTRLHLPIERLVDALADPKRCERTMISVLLAYIAVWTFYGIFAKAGQPVSPDTAELVAWSREPAFGYPKHPPLPTWVVWAWFRLFPLDNWPFYLLAMTSAALGLWTAWRLFALSRSREAHPWRCPPHSHPLLQFPCIEIGSQHGAAAALGDRHLLLHPFLRDQAPALGRARRRWRRGGHARQVLVDLSAGGVGIAALVDPRRGAYFRSGAPWVTVAIGALLLLPHLAWLVAHDFAPFGYAMAAHETTTAIVAASVVGYLAGGAGYVALPVLLVLGERALAKLAIARATAVEQTNGRPEDDAGRRFAAVAFWVPLLLPALVALAAGVELNSIWTASAWTLLPVVLLSSPRSFVSRPAFLAIVALSVLLPLLMAAAAPVVGLMQQRAGLPLNAAHSRLLAQYMAQEWRAATDRPMRLVGGDVDLAPMTAFYLPDRPSTFPVAEPHFAPWVDTARIRREGISLVCYMHPEGPWCVHAAVLNAIDDLLAHTPAVRRLEMRIPEAPTGVRGRSPGFIIYTVPPQE
jgi:hypothetical protein